MIEISGPQNTDEHSAAVRLAEVIRAAWPKVADDPAQKVVLRVSAQCPYQEVQDVDILLIINLARPYPVHIRPELAAQAQIPASYSVRNLVVAIEVKSQDDKAVRFQGNDAEVLYRETWWNASQQSSKQRYSVKNYFEKCSRRMDSPFITNVLWLRGITRSSIPANFPPLHCIVTSDLEWCDFIAAVLSSQRPYRTPQGHNELCSSRQPAIVDRLSDVFCRQLEATRMDRRKIEAVAMQSIQVHLNQSNPGRTQVIWRGRGGTGKTIALLSTAWRQYEQANWRTLFLSYNNALTADIERLLCIAGVRDAAGERSIRVRTIHSFLYEIFQALQLFNDPDDFMPRLDAMKEEFLCLITSGDIEKLKACRPDLLNWDLICIDEAQDFPEDERDIVHKLFGSDKCVVADGIDQMIRMQEACTWGNGEINYLGVGLRMKGNICRFANSFAQHAGLTRWSLQENPALAGGKVIIVVAGDFPDKRLYDRVAAANAKDGNEPVDMLFCIPSGTIDLSRKFASWGLDVWDGTSRDIRREGCINNRQHRLVYYESCRGLEGWATFNSEIDRACENRFRRLKQELRSGLPDMSASRAEQKALQMALEWTMIPMTRAIDTLVIHISNNNSLTGTIIRRVCSDTSDFVEWVY